jgi:2-methylcitrate dehydratase
MFPEKQPSRATITTKDGKVYSEYLEYPKGDPREPMTIEDIDAKFGGLADGLLSAERQKEIKETILNSETLCARDFMRQMTI